MHINFQEVLIKNPKKPKEMHKPQDLRDPVAGPAGVNSLVALGKFLTMFLPWSSSLQSGAKIAFPHFLNNALTVTQACEHEPA